MSDYHLPVNIGNPNEITLKEFVEEVIALTGTNQKIVYKPLPVDDPKQRQPTLHVQRSTGWEPKVSRKAAIKSYLRILKITAPGSRFKQPKESQKQ